MNTRKVEGRKPRTPEEINEAEWRDPGNWRAGWLGVYHSQRDTRFVVPKRNPILGFTLNFGHRAWALVLLALIAAGLGAGFFALIAALP